MDLLGESIDKMSAMNPTNYHRDIRSSCFRRRKGLCDFIYVESCRRGPACKFKHYRAPPTTGRLSPHGAHSIQILPTYYGIPSPSPYSPVIYQPIWSPWTVQLPSPSAARSLAPAGVAQQHSEPLASDLSSDVSSCSEDGLSAQEPGRSPQYFASGGNNSTYGYPLRPVGIQLSPFSSVSPMYATGPVVQQQAPPAARFHCDSASEHSRYKRSMYKTKVCKFYAETGRCTKGHRCTYIHERGEGRDPLAESVPGPSVATSIKPFSSAGQHYSSSPHKDKSKVESKKVVSDKESANAAHEYYPINWRVIGGGVMMGGSRPSCQAYAAGYCSDGDDCPYAHNTELLATDDGLLFTKGIESGIASLNLSRKILQDASTLQRPSKGGRTKGRTLPPLEIAVPAISEVINQEAEGHEGETPIAGNHGGEPVRDTQPPALLSPPNSGHRRAQSMTAIQELRVSEDKGASVPQAAEL